MPKPIVCLSTTLSQFAELFRPCFSQRQWKYFVIVLLGLIECDGRRTLRGLLSGVGEKVSLCGLSRFFNRWQWSPSAVAQVWLGRFRVQMKAEVQAEHQRQRTTRAKRRGRPKATVVTGYLIVDDSINLKVRGRKMKGLGRHYSNTAGRVVTGHCLFSGLYVLLGRRCIDLAVQEIEQFEPVEGTHTHLLIDSWFHCKKVRRAAQKRSWDVSGGLKCNRVMRLMNPNGSRTYRSSRLVLNWLYSVLKSAKVVFSSSILQAENNSPEAKVPNLLPKSTLRTCTKTTPHFYN